MLTKQQKKDFRAIAELDDTLRKQALTADERKILWAWLYTFRDAESALSPAKEALDELPSVNHILLATDRLAHDTNRELTRARRYQGQILQRLGASDE